VLPGATRNLVRVQQLPPELCTFAVPELGVQVGGLAPSPNAAPPPVVVTCTNPAATWHSASEDEPLPDAFAETTQVVSVSAVAPPELVAVA
jgi:hypothetical protein